MTFEGNILCMKIKTSILYLGGKIDCILHKHMIGTLPSIPQFFFNHDLQ